MHDHPLALSLRFSRAAAIAVILIGGLVLVGWACDIALLRSMFPGLTPMNPGGTALAFMFAGMSLWLQTPPDAHPKRRLFGRLCAACVLAIALVRVSGYLLGWPDGPDQWLFYDELSLEALRSGYLNEMAPNTAAGFVLIGLALLLLEVKIRGIWLAQCLAIACGLIGLLTIFGYAYGALSLAGVKTFIPMALNTAIAFTLISTGLLFARPQRGVMKGFRR